MLLLLTVNDRLFSLQVPKVIPGKIKAQYEDQEDIAVMQKSLANGELTFKKSQGIDNKYLSIRNEKQTNYQRNPDRIEANIKPEPHGTVVIGPKIAERDQRRPNVYDAIVNEKVVKANGMQKFTFESQELFKQANHLSQQIPHWNSEKENPIHQYIPESKRPFQTSTDFANKNKLSHRETKLMSISQNRFG